MMVDITMSSVLGKHLNNNVPMWARRFNSKVTRMWEAYIEKLEDLYLEHGVWDKLEALAKTADFPASKGQPVCWKACTA